jgi:hypothetical protein
MPSATKVHFTFRAGVCNFSFIDHIRINHPVEVSSRPNKVLFNDENILTDFALQF